MLKSTINDAFCNVSSLLKLIFSNNLYIDSRDYLNISNPNFTSRVFRANIEDVTHIIMNDNIKGQIKELIEGELFIVCTDKDEDINKRSNWIVIVTEEFVKNHTESAYALCPSSREVIINNLKNLYKDVFPDDEKAIVKGMSKMAHNDKQHIIDICKRDADEIYEKINSLTNKYIEMQAKIKELELENKQGVFEYDDLSNLFKNKKIESIQYNKIDECITFDTKTLYMRHPDMKDDIRLLGRMSIRFYMDFSVVVFNKDYQRMSYWGDGCQHPHIDECGNPCYGNLCSMLTTCKECKSIYAAILLVLDFLETYEYNDAAGKYYVCWDRVNEDGEVIELGTRLGACECQVCGEMVDEDECYECGECGGTCCSDCVTYIESCDKYICNDCYDSVIVYCECCDEAIHTDNGNDVWNGGVVCDTCRRECYIECADCGDYVHEDDARYDEEDELYYCPTCYRSRKMEE